MMFLFYEDGKMHVVIHTANLIERDWGRKSQMCWVSSLVGVKTGSGEGRNVRFGKDLGEYLSAYGNGKEVAEVVELRERIKAYDFSHQVGQIVASVPGRHHSKGASGNQMIKWGHKKLAECLKRDVVLSPDIIVNSTVICQYSSVGSLGADDKWLAKEFGASLSQASNAGGGMFQPNSGKPKWKMALVFPTVSEVRDSLQGWAAGDSIPFGNDNWMKQESYMRPLMKKWIGTRSERDRAMPHIKTFSRVNEETKEVAWIFVSSHNLSKAAWGSLEKNGTQLFIRSYEIGVLLTARDFQTSKTQSVAMKSMTAAEYRSVLPEIRDAQDANERELEDAEIVVPIRLPFDLPLTSYEANDEPWRWDVSFEGLDSHGTTRIIKK
ncbi:tyrosyl-DNA phosphodiesterase 1 [Podochytrium sp. JEL0797]|nr:tyrosyl-DNA phosphodiesterase 1 [Podochytrium sp. JEL0797]